MIVLLINCAHTQPPASLPSSMPLVDEDGWIHVEEHSLMTMPTCNRSAAEIIWLRRKMDQRKFRMEVIDSKEQIDLANARVTQANAALKEATNFGRYGIPVMIGSILVSVAVGFAAGITLWDAAHR